MKYKIFQIAPDEVIPAIVDGKDVFTLIRGFILSKLWMKPIFEIRDAIEKDDNYVFFYLEHVEDESCDGCFGASFNDCEICDDRKEVQNDGENM